MPMQWSIEDAPDHLLVKVEGDWLLTLALKMLDEVGKACRTRGYNRVLIDCRAQGGLINEMDKFVAGSRIAQRFGATRVAAVFSPGLRITGFARKVAARRGGNLFVTIDMDEAQRYLAGELS